MRERITDAGRSALLLAWELLLVAKALTREVFGWLPPWMLLGLVWLASSLLFLGTVHHGATSHAWRTLIAAGVLAGISLFYLLRILVNPSMVLETWTLAGGLVLTFLGLVASFGAADYALSHSVAHVAEHLTNGRMVHTPVYADCFDQQGVPWLFGVADAVYFALGTVTTAGAGDLAAHSETCRAVTSGELAVGFPMLGLAIAGVAAHLFDQFRNPRGWRTGPGWFERLWRRVRPARARASADPGATPSADPPAPAAPNRG